MSRSNVAPDRRWKDAWLLFLCVVMRAHPSRPDRATRGRPDRVDVLK